MKKILWKSVLSFAAIVPLLSWTLNERELDGNHQVQMIVNGYVPFHYSSVMTLSNIILGKPRVPWDLRGVLPEYVTFDSYQEYRSLKMSDFGPNHKFPRLSRSFFEKNALLVHSWWVSKADVYAGHGIEWEERFDEESHTIIVTAEGPASRETNYYYETHAKESYLFPTIVSFIATVSKKELEEGISLAVAYRHADGLESWAYTTY